MKIRDVMSKDVAVAQSADTIQEVARRMAEGDFGFMPVVDGDMLVGTITDRDIVIRAVATGATATATVGQFLSRDVKTARDDEDLQSVLDAMGDRQIRRLPIIDRHGKLVGVVSLGDLSTRVKEKHAGETLEDISRPH